MKAIVPAQSETSADQPLGTRTIRRPGWCRESIGMLVVRLRQCSRGRLCQLRPRAGARLFLAVNINTGYSLSNFWSDNTPPSGAESILAVMLAAETPAVTVVGKR